jgi:hypothetical protein
LMHLEDVVSLSKSWNVHPLNVHSKLVDTPQAQT